MVKILGLILQILGVLVGLFGLLFLSQGMGWFPYPKSSFMINETIWVIRGGIMVVMGILLFWGGRYWRKTSQARNS